MLWVTIRVEVVRSIDTSALTAPVDSAAVAGFRDTLPSDLRPSRGVILRPAISASLFSVAVAVFVIWLLTEDGSPNGDDIAVMVGTVLLGLFVVAITIVSAHADLRGRSGERQYRLHRFANDNGLSYAPVSARLHFPGLIFGDRAGQVPRDVVRDEHGLVIGNQTFTVGEGNHRRTHRWGFATVQLGTKLPHIVLDAASNNSLGLSNLPASLDRVQQLGLEGDFSEHFTLYTPRGYERDALYLFTPDVMTHFIDNAAAVDIEIIDDRLFVYSKSDLSTLDPEIWEWLFATLDALTAKVAQWQRWRDDRLGDTEVVADAAGRVRIVCPPRGVAPEGRRLSERIHWIWFALAAVGVAVGLFTILQSNNVFGY